MQYYTTFYSDFKNRKMMKDNELFLITGGAKGQQENHLLQQSDRITRLTTFDRNKDSQVDILKMGFVIESVKGTLEAYGYDKSKEEELYTQFKIPKSSGGMRTIDAPPEYLKQVQRLLVNYMKHDLKLLEHNNAHAYVDQKGTVTNARYHARSNHFAGVDFKNFFPSINVDLLKRMLPQIGYFADVNLNDDSSKTFKELIDLIIEVCTYKGGLPQGAVSSPFLSNIVMVPFDYHMIKHLREYEPNVIYTRYADDLQFSSYYAFADRKEDAKRKVERITKTAIYEAYGHRHELGINTKKTTVTTKYGKNRITGIKINKDNKLSLGYKEKRNLKQNLANLLISKMRGEHIDYTMKEEILGMFAYLNSIEPGYSKYMEKTLLQKFGFRNDSIRDAIK